MKHLLYILLIAMFWSTSSGIGMLTDEGYAQVAVDLEKELASWQSTISDKEAGFFDHGPKLKNSFTKTQALNTKQNRNSATASRQMPPMYMQGDSKKRPCVNTKGIFSGHSTFDYLSFVTAIISMVLNANNNINDNNDNNNINDDNSASNNNVDANSNSNTGNQIIVMPGGRRRRRLAAEMSRGRTNNSFTTAAAADAADAAVALRNNICWQIRPPSNEKNGPL
ncbi:unnamed protein product [Meganyctiphanes norvegica]|uniref:Uncharacterized protein n=1 Tax=Meganyctiphanes norvegica TaxID=48144 RepID=A0AAV2R9Y9_MEGNR